MIQVTIILLGIPIPVFTFWTKMGHLDRKVLYSDFVPKEEIKKKIFLNF